MEVTVGSEVFQFHESDSIGFNSGIPHELSNIGATTCEAIWVVHSQ